MKGLDDKDWSCHNIIGFNCNRIKKCSWKQGLYYNSLKKNQPYINSSISNQKHKPTSNPIVFILTFSLCRPIKHALAWFSIPWMSKSTRQYPHASLALLSHIYWHDVLFDNITQQSAWLYSIVKSCHFAWYVPLIIGCSYQGRNYFKRLNLGLFSWYLRLGLPFYPFCAQLV